MTIRSLPKSKSVVREQLFLIVFWIPIKKCKKQILCPFLMIITTLPQLIIVCVVDCDQCYNMWLRYLINSIYLIAHTPELLTFSLFIYPSTVYKNAFYKTFIGQLLLILLKRCCCR
ncbi:hypothetical protein I4U23_022049 [Adineta vaga]|nr:hypothetical protein I4U23_022049 [Adineta vaga]